MTGQTTAVDVVAAVLLATGLYFGSWALLLPLIGAEHLTPRWLRQAAVDAGHDLNRAIATGQRSARQICRASREACRDAAALVLLLTTTPKGANR